MNTSSRSDIFTRREIADYMLYETIDARYEQCHVTDLRFLDPCCGMGALLFPILKRIVEDVCSGYCAWNDIRLELVITAIDINPNYIDSLKEQTIVFLKANNCPVERAKYLVNKWFLVNDFLKYDTTVQFDVILGNPPYIRYDNLSQLQQAEYSCRYKTFTGRSDIYIPFFEHALDMLAPRGCLCYICTNRFTKSSYGKRLRNLIIRNHHVRLYLNLEHTQPFESDVSAYPAIFVIDNDMNKPTFAATINDISEETLATLHTNSSLGLSHLNRFDSWFVNGESWLFTDMRNKREIEGFSMVFLNKGLTDIYKTENIEGVPVYVVENNYLRLQLTSNRIDSNILRKISRYDYKHLDTLAELVTNKDILEWIHSEGFNTSDFYVVILRTGLRDKDFLRWWRSYGFKLNMFLLNK